MSCELPLFLDPFSTVLVWRTLSTACERVTHTVAKLQNLKEGGYRVGKMRGTGDGATWVNACCGEAAV